MPTSIDFGAVSPGASGALPGPPSDVVSLARGVSVTAPVAASVTASITGPDAVHFAVQTSVYRWELQDVEQFPGEVPGRRKGGKPILQPALVLVSEGSGAAPMPVQAGDLFFALPSFSAAGVTTTAAATLVIQGDTWDLIQVPLKFMIGDIVTTFTPTTVEQGTSVSVPSLVQSVSRWVNWA
jgi:hypothetical protein